MADETQEATQEETTGGEATEAAETAAPAPEPEKEMVFCAVSKQEVPLDETIELERKKGEVLRIHARFKKF